MWLFRHKYNVDGTLSRYKARLVANGSTQLAGIDVDETFSPVVKPATIRTVLSLAISRHWSVHQLDVKNAFLHGSLSETVYMHQPPGFRDSQHPDHGADTAYLLLYVDDIVLTASSSDLLQQIITSLHVEFSMTDLGSLNYFLGIFVTCNASGMFLSQQKYATEVLNCAGMLNYKPCRTPVDTDSKLSTDGAPIFDYTLYRSLAGALQYLTFTRPDISYVVQQVCLFMHDPREPHLSALKRILRYVRGTLSYRLQLYSSTTSSLVAYSDADWAGCPTTRRSTSANSFPDASAAASLLFEMNGSKQDNTSKEISDDSFLFPRQKRSGTALWYTMKRARLAGVGGIPYDPETYKYKPLFLNKLTMDDAWAVSSYLSDAVTLLVSLSGGLLRNYEAENIIHLTATSVGVRGVMFGNRQPLSSRWHAIRRQQLWQVEQSLWRNRLSTCPLKCIWFM
ncbi:ribonuclease H-like domain-containing protein [Tanacetum coccineum]